MSHLFGFELMELWPVGELVLLPSNAGIAAEWSCYLVLSPTRLTIF